MPVAPAHRLVSSAVLALSLWVPVVFGDPASPRSPLLVIDEVTYREGDVLTWADPDSWSADGWRASTMADLPTVDGLLWLRHELELPPNLLPPVAVFISGPYSWELFWDGERVATSGSPAAHSADEVPGAIQSHIYLPDRLVRPGRHRLALRTSHHHRGYVFQAGYWPLVIASADTILRLRTPPTAWVLVSISGLAMIALFSLGMAFVARHPNQGPEVGFALLGFLCSTAIALLFAESWRSLVGYAYHHHILRLTIITGLAWILGVLLLAFLAQRFPQRGGPSFVVVGAVASALPIFVFHGWDTRSLGSLLIAFILAALWCLDALRRRRPGAGLALLGLGTCLGLFALAPRAFIDRHLYFGMDVLLTCFLAVHVLEVRRERRQYHAAELRSTRLELELLRRQLQPHFLMNSLTALSEWVEQEPRVAIEMIHALGDELRTLAEMAARRSVSLHEELELCRRHLEIASLRNDRTFQLTSSGDSAELAIPPAVLHTLVENAVRHNHLEGSLTLHLTVVHGDEQVRYTLDAPCRVPDEKRQVRDGTGLRYVRSRLEELFPGDWHLEHGHLEHGHLEHGHLEHDFHKHFEPELRTGGRAGIWRTVIETPRSVPPTGIPTARGTVA